MVSAQFLSNLSLGLKSYQGNPFRFAPIGVSPGLRLGETDADGDEATGA
jgi:hypothetical protein